MENNTKVFNIVDFKQTIMVYNFVGSFVTFTASFPWPPQRTHDLAAFMTINDCINCGLGHKNGLIATPFYQVLGGIINSPIAYALANSLFLFFALNFNFSYHIFRDSSPKNIFIKVILAFVTTIGAIQTWVSFVDGLREAGFGVDFLHPSFSSRSPLSSVFGL